MAKKLSSIVALLLSVVFLLASCGEGECEHEWTERTCVNGSYCTKCDQVQFEDGYGHDFFEWERTKKATLKEDGVEERRCCVCGATETKTFSLMDELTTKGKKELEGFHSILKSDLLNPSSYTVNSQSGHIFHDEDSDNIYLMLAVDYSAQNKAGGYNRYSRKDYFVWHENSDGSGYWSTIDDIDLCLQIMYYEFDEMRVF